MKTAELANSLSGFMLHNVLPNIARIKAMEDLFITDENRQEYIERLNYHKREFLRRYGELVPLDRVFVEYFLGGQDATPESAS